MSLRRRRTYLVRLVLIFVCLGIFIQIKYHLFNGIPEKIFISNEIFQRNLSLNKLRFNCSGDPLKQWCGNSRNYCNSSLISFQNLFALTRSVVLHPQLAKGKRVGGENIADVLNQAEGDEYFEFEKNFIQLPCDIPHLDNAFPSSHLSNVFKSLTNYEKPLQAEINNRTTIAVNRHDYVNFYHTMTDLYTAYVLCRFFRKDPKSVQILFLDAHPKGNLDIFWSKIFHSFVRLGHLKPQSAIFYDELIWAQPQSKSELDLTRNRREAPSFFFDFREHILRQFDLNPQLNLKLNCEALNILFLVRHNYVAHPRNPSGKISRQLANEKEILQKLKIKFSSYSSINFTTNHFEELSIYEQLNIILQTDIFLGIHGAGLTHVLFLKPNRALIELVPSSQIGTHFDLMASINRIKYHRCSIDNGASNTAETIYDCINLKLLELCPNISSSTKKTIQITVTNTQLGNVSNTNRK